MEYKVTSLPIIIEKILHLHSPKNGHITSQEFKVKTTYGIQGHISTYNYRKNFNKITEYLALLCME